MEQFQTSTLSLFRALQSSRWAPTLYSSSCLVHCLSSNADWYQFTTNGVSLMEAVKRWFFRPTTGVYSVLRPANIIDSCTGWNCTLKCSGGPWQARFVAQGGRRGCVVRPARGAAASRGALVWVCVAPPF